MRSRGSLWRIAVTQDRRCFRLMLSLASRTFRPVSSVHFCVSSQTRTFLGLAGYSKRLKGMIKEQKEQRRSGKLRGHPRDSPEVQLSKTVTWLLRHGAKSQGLPMREDGYVRVTDLVSRHRRCMSEGSAR